MATSLTNDGLFELPAETRREPLARVIIVCGPSGSGKTRFVNRTGLPVVSLDDFYFEGSQSGLPHRHGMIDWDSIKTWNKTAAITALVDLCTTGRAEIPIYDIPTNSQIGVRTAELDGRRYVLTEGIFAADIIEDLRNEGILADAMCIERPRFQTFWFRLMRDLDEARKPLINLLRRGFAHFRREPKLYLELESKGARRVSYAEAQEALTQILAAQRW
ncbi:MAG: ATP-binding protein [Arcanobacterium sp.]|nr:ATP-binding protein [Arcanobacterium sp.]